ILNEFAERLTAAGHEVWIQRGDRRSPGGDPVGRELEFRLLQRGRVRREHHRGGTPFLCFCGEARKQQITITGGTPSQHGPMGSWTLDEATENAVEEKVLT